MDETLTDDALLEIAKHDVEAFGMLYRRHLHRVYSYLLSRAGNVHDAQDLTTQTFMAALNGMETYQPRGFFVAWLLGIAKRKLSDHFRDTTSTIGIDDIDFQLDSQDLLEKKVLNRLQMQEVAVILAKLNPERAEALRLRYFANLKIREVADVMEKSEGAVKMLIARGLDDIRHGLGIQEKIS